MVSLTFRATFLHVHIEEDIATSPPSLRKRRTLSAPPTLVDAGMEATPYFEAGRRYVENLAERLGCPAYKREGLKAETLGSFAGNRDDRVNTRRQSYISEALAAKCDDASVDSVSTSSTTATGVSPACSSYPTTSELDAVVVPPGTVQTYKHPYHSERLTHVQPSLPQIDQSGNGPSRAERLEARQRQGKATAVKGGGNADAIDAEINSKGKGCDVAGQGTGKSKGKGKGRTEVEKASVIDAVEPVHDEPITTLMICNIPCRFTHAHIADVVDSMGFEGRYDFLHIPLPSAKSKGNLGYGFINFLTHEDAMLFVKNFSNVRFQQAYSTKVTAVCPARIQGLAANLAQFRQARLFGRGQEPRILFDKDGRRRENLDQGA